MGGVRHRALFAWVAVAAAVVACGSPSHPPGLGDTFSPDPEGDGISNDGGVTADGGLLGDPWTGLPSCAAETQFVYAIDDAGVLHRFDPPSVTFTTIGSVACPGSPFSMAIDRKSVAWVLFSTGELARVDTRTGKCKATNFVAGQHGFSTLFGMGFSSDQAGGDAETLFVEGDAPSRLARLDTTSLELTLVAPVDAINDPGELTGTGDGRLFAAFEATPYVVAELDKSSAHVESQAVQTPISYPPAAYNFAFSFWGGDFYLFAGPGTSTDVYRYRPADGTTVKLSHEAFAIVGAGVSTCAPTVGPK